MQLSDQETNEPVYFWKPEEENGFLGQWYPSSFSWKQGIEGFHYANAEQYMMHRKALLFAGPDHAITRQIQQGWKLHPRELRNLGRKIPHFSEDVWEGERYAIVQEGNFLKFSQNDDLKQQLLATGERELVEASPRDRIWGIGFEKESASLWRNKWGLNLLGKALMETRQKLTREKLYKLGK